MCPVWLLVAVVVVGGARGAVNQCWDHPSCQELNADSSRMECIRLCLSDIAHLQVPPPSGLASFLLPPSSPPQSKPKPPFSMEHFRWGKPVGWKRRPEVYTSNGVEEESAEAFPGDMRRSRLEEEEEEELRDTMKRLRWGVPSADKRYGGFMKSGDERSQRPLLTLFKNVINKNAPQRK